MPPANASAPTTITAIAQAGVPLEGVGRAAVVTRVVGGGTEVLVVVVVVVAGDDAVVPKATTRVAVGTRNSPAPTEGVGKWFAGTPTSA